ncbi:MAG: hypothetical protein GYA31_00610 [Parcubacteria group bacterium]|nr:hypothetical protein [Parcubacteria group bacterium]
MNKLTFWCLFEKKCGDQCIFNLLPATDYRTEKQILEGFEKQCSESFCNFCNTEIPEEFKLLTDQAILAIKQLNLYFIRKKLQWNGINIEIPPILEGKINAMKHNKALIATLSCYEGPKKLMKVLRIIKR